MNYYNSTFDVRYWGEHEFLFKKRYFGGTVSCDMHGVFQDLETFEERFHKKHEELREEFVENVMKNKSFYSPNIPCLSWCEKDVWKTKVTFFDMQIIGTIRTQKEDPRKWRAEKALRILTIDEVIQIYGSMRVLLANQE